MAAQTKTGDAVEASVKLCAALNAGATIPNHQMPSVPEIPSAQMPNLNPQPSLPQKERTIEELTKNTEALKPFIDLGNDIAGGKLSWK